MNKITYDNLNETLYSYTHPSGLKVFMVVKKGFAKSCAYFSTDYGSTTNRFIPKGENELITVPDGVAHFLEHKVFEQPDGASVFDAFSKYGAYANAYTSFNMTTYYFWCTENFRENLKILVDFVQTPYFTDENVAKEQGIIGQEIKMYEDDPNWSCYFNMLQGLYSNHTVRLDIAGSVESISKITKDTLYTCYNTFYNPSNMTLCMVGDFDPAEMEKYLDGILKKVSPIDEIVRIMPEEPAKIAKAHSVRKMSVATPVYTIGFKETDLSGAIELRRAAAKTAMELLIGKSSKLYASLYNDGLISASFSTDYTGETDYGFAEIADESEMSEKMAERILQGIKDFKFDTEEFERIKRKRFGRSLHVFDDPENYAGALARNTTCGADLYKSIELAEQVTEKDVKKVFETMFTPENMTLSEIKRIDK
ncbi:MAG: insulinase family protein [Clostridia bacterium]|nr:insulinase family protein [Clostridia bacterium]